MKRFLLMIILFAWGGVQPLMAEDHHGDSSFYVEADFIWWKPCIDRLEYAAIRTATGPATFQMKDVEPDWEPGVRIALGLKNIFCDWELKGSYTYIAPEGSDSILSDPDAIVSPIIHPALSATALGDSGFGTLNDTYHEWDLVLGRNMVECDGHCVKSFFGLAGIMLEQEFDTTIVDDSSDEIMGTMFDSDFWGVGFRCGSEYRCHINDCWTFFTGCHGTILVGEAETMGTFDDDDSGTSPDLIYYDHEICQMVSGYHLSAGMEYQFHLWECPLSVKVSYEFLQWHNIPNPRTFVGDTSATTEDVMVSGTSNHRTYGFHGLMAGISASF